MKVDEVQLEAARQCIKWVAGRVREVRKAKGMTQKQLAARLGICHSRVSDFERATDDFKMSTLLRLAAVLDVSLHVLMDGAPIVQMQDTVKEKVKVGSSSITASASKAE